MASGMLSPVLGFGKQEGFVFITDKIFLRVAIEDI